MDYKKASRIRKKGLLELIAENKFENGQGLGSSIGGAISDKLKARATGFKEKFDPLNMIRALTGEGVIGKSITTVVGRATGRSEDAIGYFGGYARKKRVSGTKGDPLVTKIGPGNVVRIRSGDGLADILAKMYNFMEKTHETYKLNYELEESFRKEQLEEDENRHKKLIESILGRKTSTATPAKEEGGEKSFLEKIAEKITSAFAGIVAAIGNVAGFIFNFFTSALGKVVSLLTTTIFATMTPLVDFLVAIGIKSALHSFANAVVGMISTIAPWAGNIARGALAAWLGNELIDADKKILSLMAPEEITKQTEMGSGSDYDKARERYNNAVYNKADSRILNKLKKEQDVELEKLQQELDAHLKTTLVPTAKILGYDVDFSKRNARVENFGLMNGLTLPTITNSEGKTVMPETLALQVAGFRKLKYGKEMIEGKVEDILPENFKWAAFDEGIRSVLPVPKLSTPSSEVPAAPNVTPKVDNTKTEIPVKQEDTVNSSSTNQAPIVVATNNTNNIGGSGPKIIDTNSTAVRNSEIQPQTAPI